MATLITQNGDVIDGYDASDLNKKQKAVGGFIEYVRTSLGMTFCVNEEALALGLKPNILASAISGTLLFGNVLMMTESEVEMEDKS
jgi:hypothetical protein